jgi:heme/copper-type cytochrome/quinol oxidase subunit 4
MYEYATKQLTRGMARLTGQVCVCVCVCACVRVCMRVLMFVFVTHAEARFWRLQTFVFCHSGIQALLIHLLIALTALQQCVFCLLSSVFNTILQHCLPVNCGR